MIPEGTSEERTLIADPEFRTRSALESQDARSRAEGLAAALSSTAVRLAEAASPAYAFLRRFAASGATVIAEGHAPAGADRPADTLKTFVADSTAEAVSEVASVSAQAVLSGSFGPVGDDSCRRLAALSMFTDEGSQAEAGRIRAQLRKGAALRGAASLAATGDQTSAAFGAALRACASEASALALKAASRAEDARGAVREGRETAAIAARILPGAFARAAAHDLKRIGASGNAALRIGAAVGVLARRATSRLEEAMKATREQLAALGKFFTNGATVIMEGVRPVASSPHIRTARGVMIGAALGGLAYTVHMDQNAAVERFETASAQVSVQYKASREAAEAFVSGVQAESKVVTATEAPAAAKAVPMPPPRKPLYVKPSPKPEYSRTKIVPPSIDKVSTVGRLVKPSADYLAAATANLADRMGDLGLAKGIIAYQLAWGETCTSKIRYDGEECRIESEGSVMDFSHGWFASYLQSPDGNPELAAREFEGQTIVSPKIEHVAAAAPKP